MVNFGRQESSFLYKYLILIMFCVCNRINFESLSMVRDTDWLRELPAAQECLGQSSALFMSKNLSSLKTFHTQKFYKNGGIGFSN